MFQFSSFVKFVADRDANELNYYYYTFIKYPLGIFTSTVKELQKRDTISVYPLFTGSI